MSYTWRLKVKGGWDESEHPRVPKGRPTGGRFAPKVAVKYDPRQPRMPKGTPQGGQWTSFPQKWLTITSKENTLARGDDTELYRWSNLAEIVDATRGETRRASFDVTDQPWWYFAPPGMTPRTGWVANTYGRVVLDREKLREAGWRYEEAFAAEGAWFWKPGNLGGSWRDYPDRFVIDSYLNAIRGYEVTNLGEGGSLEQIRSILKYRLGREVPVMLTTVAHVTEPFRHQRPGPGE